MGGRVPIQSMLSMAKSVGFQAEVLIYTWKIQSEPEEVIGGYKKNQEDGLGPVSFLFAFHFVIRISDLDSSVLLLSCVRA